MNATTNLTHLEDILDWVTTNDFSISITSERIGFLLAIHTLQHTSNAELTEDVLIDLYRQVLSHRGEAELTDATSAARANKIINDLVTQKLLNRFSTDFADDTPLEDSAAIYRLSPLAMGIADNYLRQKEFSQVALSVQLGMVAKEMDEIVDNAQQSPQNYLHWRNQIYDPLRYSVAEIFKLIDYRQRELDEEQQQIKQQISDLLSKNWNAAIDTCKDLLNSTSDTLRELQDTLSSAGARLQDQLIQINIAVQQQQAALQAIAELKAEPELKDTLYADNDELLTLVAQLETEFDEVERQDLEKIFSLILELIQNLQTKLDRIIAWGQQSIDLWLGFDRHIHKFIRTTIDLDKNRVFSTRLRRSVSEFLDQPFFLTFANQERILDMRDEVMELVDGEELGELPEEIEYETYDDISEQISQMIQSVISPLAIKREPLNIVPLLRKILSDNPLSFHFDIARIFIDQAMRFGLSSDEISGIQAAWRKVNEQNAEVQANVIDLYNNTPTS